jgi:hypothetical protein
MKKILISILACLSLAAPAGATAQIGETIIIDGKAEHMTIEPLGVYLNKPENFDRFKQYAQPAGCTALWRGYVGEWEIKEKKLYLNKLNTGSCSEKDRGSFPLDKLFPDQPQPVLAKWYSGILIMPRGKLVEYVHMGYASRFERYLVMDIQEGVVIKQETLTDKQFQKRFRHQ